MTKINLLYCTCGNICTLSLSLTIFSLHNFFPPLQLSSIKSDLEEMGFIMSGTESSLTEQLLPSKYSFFIRER